MNKSVIRQLAAGWIGVMGWVGGTGRAVLAEPTPAPRMTVRVYNWAEVEPDTLQETQGVAARVFRNAGLEAAVLDPQSRSAKEGQDANLSTFIVHLVSREMAKRFRLPSTMLGVAPGTPKDKNRTTVYVFDHVATSMAQEHQEQVLSQVLGIGTRPVHKGQILGYAIAHEIGHVLLDLKAHTKRGVMQAKWNRDALTNVATGRLNFSHEEATRIQVEVARRSRN